MAPRSLFQIPDCQSPISFETQFIINENTLKNNPDWKSDGVKINFSANQYDFIFMKKKGQIIR